MKKIAITLLALIVTVSIIPASYFASNYANFLTNSDTTETQTPLIPTAISEPTATPAPSLKISYSFVGELYNDLDMSSSEFKVYPFPCRVTINSHCTIVIVEIHSGVPYRYDEIMESSIKQFYIINKGEKLLGNYSSYWSYSLTDSGGGKGIGGYVIYNVYGNFTLDNNYTLAIDDFPLTITWVKTIDPFIGK